MKSINENYGDLLFDAVLKLKDRDECLRFFNDLCSIEELRSMSRRMEVAQLLYERMSYNDIAARTGASTATISRVNKCLNYGQNGYNLVLKRLKEQENGELQ